MYEKYRDESAKFWGISKKFGNSNRIVGIIFDRKSPKYFLNDIEKSPKQCMVVTLRSGKELDEPKKIEDDGKQVQ